MLKEIARLFEDLWEPYARQNPQVPLIHRLIAERERGTELYNDHMALRTFGHPRVGLAVLAKSFVRLGFEERGQFHLKAKNVFAKYYTHSSGQWPRVFISELIWETLSPQVQKLIEALLQQIPQGQIDDRGLCYRGRPWSLTHVDYERLRKESEYAAWMAAHGFQMNHATLSVNKLKTFKNLEELVDFLRTSGFKMNGESEEKVIQVAKDAQGRVVLKQASTIASRIPVTFSDGTFEIPGCYYEFLQRFHDYDSFDPGNASKIMESTDTKWGHQT